MCVDGRIWVGMAVEWRCLDVCRWDVLGCLLMECFGMFVDGMILNVC